MKLKRNYITPYLSWSFVVIGITGTLMFFHVLDGYTEVVHEFLGLLFVLFSIFHVIINWKSLQTHFRKKQFSLSFIVISFLSMAFIYLGRGHGDHKRLMMDKLTKAPIHKTFQILDINRSEAMILLRKNDIVMGNSTTIEEIGLKNQIPANDVLELILR